MIFPAIGNQRSRYQLCLYVDHCHNGFQPTGAWRLIEPVKGGWTRTYGLDVGQLRLRILLEKLNPRARWEWGLL